MEENKLILIKALIDHAKYFGILQDALTKNVNVEYLAGIEIIVDEWYKKNVKKLHDIINFL